MHPMSEANHLHEESCPIYIFEKGKFHCVSGYAPPCKPTETKRRKHSTKFLTENLYGGASTEAKALGQTPTLKTLCLGFVAQNIHHVESLVGFPDIVGEELFTTIKQQRPWPDIERGTSFLYPFLEAYSSQVLSEVDLSNVCGRPLEECVNCLSICHLHKIDLAGCHLGDQHELLQVLGKMKSLTHINLQYNELSASGLRIMTGPQRIFQNGPADLRVLDLSCNPNIGDDCIRFLLCFHFLDTLDLTGTRVSGQGVVGLESRLQLQVMKKIDDTDFIAQPLCTNHGWAADLMTTWTRQPQRSERTACNSTDNSPAEVSKSNSECAKGDTYSPRRFYSRKGKRLALAHGMSNVFKRPLASPRLQLRAVDREARQQQPLGKAPLHAAQLQSKETSPEALNILWDDSIARQYLSTSSSKSKENNIGEERRDIIDSSDKDGCHVNTISKNDSAQDKDLNMAARDKDSHKVHLPEPAVAVSKKSRKCKIKVVRGSKLTTHNTLDTKQKIPEETPSRRKLPAVEQSKFGKTLWSAINW